MGETLSFEELCQHYRPILRSVIESRLDQRLLPRLDASDVVQEALLEAFERMEEYQRKQPMPLAAWLRETALQQLKRACRKHRGAARRSVTRQVSYDQSSVFRLAERLTAVTNTAEHQHQMVEDSQRVWQCLNHLSDNDREILMLRYVNGLTNLAAAQLLNVSETVASKRHCRALLRLRVELADDSK